METLIGKRMYRGILKTVARVWNPREIQDSTTQERVLTHMHAADRGFRRVKVAVDKAGLGAFAAALARSGLKSLDQIEDLKTLHRILLAVEERPPERTSV